MSRGADAERSERVGEERKRVSDMGWVVLR